FTILVLRMSMMFQPLKVFAPLGLTCLALGGAKAVFDLLALFFRHDTIGWYLLFQPVLSTSAMLLLLGGAQLLLVGMVADGVIRRIGQQQRPPVPSQALSYLEAESEPVLPPVEVAPRELVQS